MQTPNENKIKEVMSFLGKQGTGLSKVRGDRSYYQGLVRVREAKRRANKAHSTASTTDKLDLDK